MPDIFSRQTDQFDGSFSADSSILVFTGLADRAGERIGATTGLLVQNMQATYTQQVTRLFEVGSSNIYYVGGRSDGQASLARVVGPRALQAEFYTTYGNVCNAGENNLIFRIGTGCGINRTADGGSSTPLQYGVTAEYLMKFCVIQSIGMSITAQDMLINESLQMLFSSFTYVDSSLDRTISRPISV